MSDAGADERGSGVLGDLSAGLKALAANGGVREQTGVDGHGLVGPSVPALPSLSRPLAESNRRPPSPEGLAVADRILAAAGTRVPVPAPVIPLSPEQEVVAPRVFEPPNGKLEEKTMQVAEVVAHAIDVAADVTVLPRTATLLSASQEPFVIGEGDVVVVGRAPGPGGLTVDNLEVSRRQVRLEMRLGQLLVTELGSTNGTSVVSATSTRDLRVRVAVPLAFGDRLVVNGDVLLCTVARLEGER